MSRSIISWATKGAEKGVFVSRGPRAIGIWEGLTRARQLFVPLSVAVMFSCLHAAPRTHLQLFIAYLDSLSTMCST